MWADSHCLRTETASLENLAPILDGSFALFRSVAGDSSSVLNMSVDSEGVDVVSVVRLMLVNDVGIGKQGVEPEGEGAKPTPCGPAHQASSG